MPRPGPALASPRPSRSRPRQPGVLTLVLVFDREAEDVARAEASAVVYAAVEKRMGVCVWDVQDLARGRHVASDALVRWDADLITLPRQGWSRKQSWPGYRQPSNVTCFPGPLRPYFLTSSSTTPPSNTLATSSF